VEAAVERTVKPLLAELAQLEKTREGVGAWQADVAKGEERARNLLALAEMAHQRLEDLPGSRSSWNSSTSGSR
jgi:hypothetical protein